MKKNRKACFKQHEESKVDAEIENTWMGRAVMASLGRWLVRSHRVTSWRNSSITRGGHSTGKGPAVGTGWVLKEEPDVIPLGRDDRQDRSQGDEVRWGADHVGVLLWLAQAACHNKIPRPGGLYNQNLCPTLLE